LIPAQIFSSFSPRISPNFSFTENF